MALWRNFLFFFSIPCVVCFGSLQDDVERISMFYKLGDLFSANLACEKAKETFGEQDVLLEWSLKIYAGLGELRKASLLIKKHPSFQGMKDRKDMDVLEALGWGVLSNVTKIHEGMQAMSIIGAFLTHDARAVKMMKEHLASSSAMLRCQAIRAAVMYRDPMLISIIKEMLLSEKNYYVRLELMRAVGALKLAECTFTLKEIIASASVTDEEKFTALAAIIEIYDELTEEEFKELSSSSRAPLRSLSCQIAASLEAKEYIPCIFGMLSDPSPDVKLSALSALAMLGVKHLDQDVLRETLEEFIGDDRPLISIAGEWLLFREALPSSTPSRFKEWLYHENPKIRLITAGVMGFSGAKMAETMYEEMKRHFDPYIRLNLALALVRYQCHLEEALDVIDHFLLDPELKLMKANVLLPMMEVMAPSEVRHAPIAPQFPLMVDQMVRLELLNVLTTFDYKNAKEKIREILKKRLLHVTASAAAILLEDGELEAIDSVRELLDDQDEQVVVQAALVLASLGKDTTVLPCLMKIYKGASWELKLSILEALGHLASIEAVPFLIEAIDEPFQLIKIVAASSLIQCLYH